MQGNQFQTREKPEMNPKLIVGFFLVLVLIFAGQQMIRTIPAGHVGVTTLFGKVQAKPFEPGFHVVNPLLSWTLYDIRQKTHLERASVPTQDQLQTQVEVSIQYRILGSMAPVMLQETGLAEQAIEVHLVPKLRSVVREQGKTIKRAEDFFLEETQDRLQGVILAVLKEYLAPMGIDVQAVLIRDISLPPFITKAIEAKKQREQEVEKQRAELERFRTEQEQQIAEATAKRKASEEEAAQVRVLADARAYEIQKLNEAIGKNDNYIKLEALKALRSISQDPAAKIYFLNGDSPNPLPLMHMGEK